MKQIRSAAVGAAMLLSVALNAQAAEGAHPHWAYDGAHGPSEW